MKRNIWSSGVMLLTIFFSSVGCTLTAPGILSAKPPATFQESDLVGMWIDDNGSETLVLNDDNTFSHSYEISADGSQDVEQGVWSVESKSSGCVYVHLEGMRYYHLTRQAALNGNRDLDNSPILFWDPCEEQTITMLDKVVLIVGSEPDFPKGIRLEYPLTERDVPDIWLHLSPSD